MQFRRIDFFAILIFWTFRTRWTRVISITDWINSSHVYTLWCNISVFEKFQNPYSVCLNTIRDPSSVSNEKLTNRPLTSRWPKQDECPTSSLCIVTVIFLFCFLAIVIRIGADRICIVNNVHTYLHTCVLPPSLTYHY